MLLHLLSRESRGGAGNPPPDNSSGGHILDNIQRDGKKNAKVEKGRSVKNFTQKIKVISHMDVIFMLARDKFSGRGNVAICDTAIAEGKRLLGKTRMSLEFATCDKYSQRATLTSITFCTRRVHKTRLYLYHFVTTQPSKRLYVGEIRLYAPYVVAR
jgi:hypothetical protein